MRDKNQIYLKLTLCPPANTHNFSISKLFKAWTSFLDSMLVFQRIPLYINFYGDVLYDISLYVLFSSGYENPKVAKF